MKLVPAILLALAPFAAQAVVDTTSTTDPGATDAAWSWVGSMSGASAVAVGPHTILTAGHVGMGTFSLGGLSYAAVSTAVAPKIDGTKVDLRVVQLSGTLPGWYGLGTSAAKRSVVTMVGFGGAGVVKNDGAGYSLMGGGARRAGTNLVSDRKTWKNRGPVLTSMLNGAGESVLAGGDSGGGWFVDGELVGISSFVFSNNNRKSDFGWSKKAYFGSGAVNLTNSKVRKWVLSQTPMSRGFILPSAAPQAVPEPGTWAALGLGVAAFLRRRKAA